MLSRIKEYLTIRICHQEQLKPHICHIIATVLGGLMFTNLGSNRSESILGYINELSSMDIRIDTI